MLKTKKKISRYLLLLRGLEHLFGSEYELIFVFNLLLKHGYSSLQLINQSLFFMTFCIEGAVFPPERRHLLLCPLRLLQRKQYKKHNQTMQSSSNTLQRFIQRIKTLIALFHQGWSRSPISNRLRFSTQKPLNLDLKWCPIPGPELALKPCWSRTRAPDVCRQSFFTTVHLHYRSLKGTILKSFIQSCGKH